ncbi:MAG: sigma-54 dependent transcriptional regulator [Spirochaetales bacterium]|nr:sigma-54 dependent transcriptional regulator [Spirochaetales bacterium]
MRKVIYFDTDCSRLTRCLPLLRRSFEVLTPLTIQDFLRILGSPADLIILLGTAPHKSAALLPIIRTLEAKLGSLADSPDLARRLEVVLLDKDLLEQFRLSTSAHVHCLDHAGACHLVHRIMSVLQDPPSTSLQTQPSGMVGTSPVMRRVFARILEYARQDNPVLIIGETGTGKELIAHALHHYSSRSRGPFVAINCAAIPDALFESEMFGTEKGAFTDATSRRGAIEQAEHGTLFLDEIGSLSPSSQPRLLRVLESGDYRKLGGERPFRTNFRLVSASCINPMELARTGKFRTDLLYRIADLLISVPPLRERLEDIPLLARHFCKQFSEGNCTISPLAMQKLTEHPWPGNVRELRSVIARACARHRHGIIHPENLEFLDDYCMEATE